MLVGFPHGIPESLLEARSEWWKKMEGCSVARAGGDRDLGGHYYTEYISRLEDWVNMVSFTLKTLQDLGLLQDAKIECLNEASVEPIEEHSHRLGHGPYVIIWPLA